MTFYFDDPAMLDSACSGGKGASLARLYQGGFPVPEGFLVSAIVYEEWLAQYPNLSEITERLPEDDPAALQRACLELQRELRLLPWPLAARKELAGALACFSDDAVFAVRSSATTEDLAQAAFAGQHETFLACRGEEEIADRIRECWVSLWSERAVDYRRRAGFEVRAASMAVVIQRLVASEVAGVGFSMDPVSGRTDRLVFDANYGLGESVVSGETEVDHYVLDKKTLAVLQSDVAIKTLRVVDEQGGARSEPMPLELQEKPCLLASHLQELGTLLRQVEDFYAHPVDIEWAWAEGRLWLLQARPITRIPPRWTRDEAAERFPNVVSPLTWDFVGRGFHRSLNHSLALMGLPPYHDQWFALFDHYIYGNQNAVEIYAERLPFSLKGLEDFQAQLPLLVERFSWVWELPVQWSQNLDRYLLRLGRLDAELAQASGLPQLWMLLRKLQDIGEDYFLPNIAISITQRSLHRLLFFLLGWLVGREEAPATLDSLMANCETKTSAVNRSLLALAMEIQRHSALMEKLLASSASDFLKQGGFAMEPELASAFDRFLEDHGHREVEYDPYVPTWLEAPQHVVEHLRALVTRPKDADDGPRIGSSRAEEDLLARTPEDMQVVLRELIRLTRSYTALDDLEHYQTTRLYLPFRRLLLKMGEELKRVGGLGEPSDIFFCRLEDLGSAIKSGKKEDYQNLRQAVAKEKEAYLSHRESTPSWVLGEEEHVPEGQTLQGSPGSPGQAEGFVFIVRSADDFADFPDQAVLVARTTNPAWTPLFYKAVAVVTESGGPLSHGAVTAREMGLPAVMSVRSVLSLLHNGQRVRVHGQQGLVEILDKL